MNKRNYKIEISNKKNVVDIFGSGIKHDIIDLGINGVTSVNVSHIYRIQGNINIAGIRSLCKNLLVDPITQKYKIYIEHKDSSNTKKNTKVCSNRYTIEVWFKPGVTDTVGESVLKSSSDMGIKNITEIKTGTKYIITGKNLKYKDIEKICNRLLANSVIQSYQIN
jgi:phosphoribosylformylglycinamidine synthase